MTGRVSLFLMSIILAAGAAIAAPAGTPVYVLNGYRFEGILGPKNTVGLVAKLKHQPGARVTEPDIKADVAILANELHARHLRGRLFTGLAETDDGHLWVHFDLAPLAPPQGADRWMSRRLESQHFEGPAGIADSLMAAATGLKGGDTISTENIEQARKGLLALYAKVRSSKGPPLVRLRVEIKPDNKVALTWMLRDRT